MTLEYLLLLFFVCSIFCLFWKLSHIIINLFVWKKK